MGRRLMTLFGGLVIGAGLVQAHPGDDAPPTRIEQAVIEHECTSTRASGAPDAEYEACLTARLTALRNDLGPDLGRLSTSERRTIDSFCASIGVTRGREARVKCLSTELGALRLRRKRANPLPVGPELPADAALGSSDTGAPQSAAKPSRLLITGALFLTALAVSGGLFVFSTKGRPVARKCQTCGSVVEAGGLCDSCRRAVADALRRTTADRADERRKADQERRRSDELKEQQRRELSRRAEEERLVQEQERARRAQEEERKRQHQEEVDRRRAQMADASRHEELDPHVVLELPRGATPQQIAAAYEKAKARFDPMHTTHLSEEVQDHFRRKSEAVDRAYQRLTAALTAWATRAG